MSELIEDFYLSDVHVECASVNGSNGLKISRVEFTWLDENEVNDEKETCLDPDGDLEVKRPKPDRHVILIEHSMQTVIDQVGLQLWRASFFMCDFILNNRDLFEGRIVLDLGAGLGITSFFAGLVSRLVICTDRGFIVKQAERNFLLNKESLSQIKPGLEILFKNLTWSENESELFEKESSRNSQFFIDEADLELVKNASVLIAADVVYDDLITIKLLRTVYKLMTCGDSEMKTCFLANERRINFTLNELNATDSAFDYFQQCLNDLNDFLDEEKKFIFKTNRVDCDLMKQFVQNYKRNKYLSIWKIECKKI